MKRHLTIALAFMLVSMTLFAQDNNNTDYTYIEVNGKAEKEFTPDEIFVKLVLTEEESRGKKSLERMERTLFENLESIGIDIKEDITISDMQSTLEKFFLKKENIASSREYSIKTKNAAQLAQLFEVVKKNEISDVTITHARLSDPEAAGRELIALAAANARKNAEALAKGLGQTLGKAIYAQSYSGFQGQLYMNQSARGIKVQEAAMADQSYEIPDFRKIKLTHNVTVRFELE